jgi:Ni,Fe-hydrogenase III large subunit/NADH:ubiquinone oxidoreductase subunit C
MTAANKNWIENFKSSLLLKKAITAQQTIELLPPVKLLAVEHQQWFNVVKLAAEYQLRFAGIWGQEQADGFEVNAIFEYTGDYLLLRTKTEQENPVIASITPIYVAADRQERHIHDLLGIIFSEHPNFKRWTKHRAWDKKQFPLRKTEVIIPLPETPPDNDYEFLKASGNGVCEAPVGPIHAGIIEPGHFRFQIAGEDVINLEERLGYVHKGIEKIAMGRSIDQLLNLAGKVSGDSTIAHTWAAAQACERALDFKIPERASWLRAIMLERERIANHLGDIGALCNDVAFAFGYYQFSRLRELWQRVSGKIFGHRLLMNQIILGGVMNDVNLEHIKLMEKQIEEFSQELAELYAALDDNSSLQNRMQTTGILSLNAAKRLGVLGYAGRASGIKFDARKDTACFPYNNLEFQIPVLVEGDCAARMKVRMNEIAESLKLSQQLLNKLPDGAVKAKVPAIAKKTE